MRRAECSSEVGFLERGNQMIAPNAVTIGEVAIIAGGHAQRCGTGLCRGAAAPTVRKSCTLRIAFVIAGGAMPSRRAIR